jgi:hypothetical protein
MSGSSGIFYLSLRSKPLAEIGSGWICPPYIGGLGDSGLAHFHLRDRFARPRLFLRQLQLNLLGCWIKLADAEAANLAR